VTSTTSASEVNEIIRFCKKHSFQATFKQLYGFGDGGNFRKLKSELVRTQDFDDCEVRFLRQDEYNLYFMPDNQLHTKFIIQNCVEMTS
jgi:hypothetical protein